MVFTEKTIADFFEMQVEKQPDHEFLIYPDRDLRYSYKEFNERANNLAKGLLAIGIKKGDHVGIWAKNVPDWLTFMFATAKIGAVLVTVNTAYKSHELEYVLDQSDMKALAMTDEFRGTSYIEMLYELVPELKTCQRGHLKSDKFPFLEYVIHVGQEKHRGMYNTNELILLGKNQSDDVLVEGYGEGRCPVKMLALHGHAGEGYLKPLALDGTRIGQQLVELVGRRRHVVFPQQVLGVAQVGIDATRQAIIEEGEIYPHVILELAFPAQVGVGILVDHVGGHPLPIVPERTAVGEQFHRLQVAAEVVARYPKARTQLEVVHPVGIGHEVLAADAPARAHRREPPPLVVGPETGRTLAADGSREQVLLVIIVVDTGEA